MTASDRHPELCCTIHHLAERHLFDGTVLCLWNAAPVFREKGAGYFRDAFLHSVKGSRAVHRSSIFYAARYFAEDDVVRRTFRTLIRSPIPFGAVPVIYAGLFLFDTEPEVPSILSEKLLLKSGGKEVLEDIRRVFDIWQSTRSGTCRLCGQTATSHSTQKQRDWVPRLVLSK